MDVDEPQSNTSHPKSINNETTSPGREAQAKHGNADTTDQLANGNPSRTWIEESTPEETLELMTKTGTAVENDDEHIEDVTPTIDIAATSKLSTSHQAL